MKDYRIRLIEILNEKVTEGLELVKGLNVTDKEYASTILNIVNSDKSAKDLQSQIDFDKEQAELAIRESEEN